jgi:hypothetical protein
VHQIHHNERSVDWIHVLWEAFQVVDGLAKHRLSLNVDFKSFNIVSRLIYLPLWADSACISFPRVFYFILGVLSRLPTKKNS